jgi:pimeloyl-ACP methyl ester carboxylesterase
MSIKHILITEPTDPVLRRLAMQFLHKPELHRVCLGEGAGGVEEHLQQMALTTEQGYPGLRDCEEISVDEIWHTANAADSIEECKHKMERALMFANREKAPTFHYLSVSTVAVLRAEPSLDGAPQCSTEEQKHLVNEIAVEQRDCKFRIYRLPLSPQILFHPASGWTQFVQHLTRFKIEIEDRIPGYFTAQPLHFYLPQGATIDIACVNDIAQAMEQILKNDTNGAYFHIRTAQPLSLNECLCVLAESTGVHLQSVPSREQQNYVDRLFDARMENFLRYLERLAQVTTAAVPNKSSTGQVWFSVPPISPQEFVAACHSKLQSAPSAPVDWKSGVDQKQVVLSDRGVLNYYIGGEGQEMLVLLNAYGQSFRYWERLIPAISRWFRIILWTPRGNDGDTIGLKVASSQAVHADDLEKVLGQEKIENCTLLAWCTGPKLALEYYQRYPDRVASMVFVAASFKGLRQYESLETEYEKHLESLLEAIEKYPETANVALEYLKGTLLSQGNQARSSDEGAAMSDRELQQALSTVNVSLQELVLHPFHASSVVAYAKQMREFWNHDVVTALDKVKVPVLFVGGDCDQIASQAIAKLVAGMMPEVKYLEIKGGSHYLHYDRWDLLADVIGQVVNTGGKREFSAAYTNR